MGFWGRQVHISNQPTNPLDTDVSTADTIRLMSSLSLTSSVLPIVHEVLSVILTAANQTATGRTTSERDIARAVFYWVKSHINYAEDEAIMSRELGIPYSELDKELLISPAVLLSMPMPYGDCDDFSVITATLLCAAHIKCSFVTVALDSTQPFRFSHVYVRAYPNGSEPMYLDASQPESFPGWETNRHNYKRMEWAIN